MKRDIFKYEGVGGTVSADPQVILRGIVRACDFDLNGVLGMCKSENPAQQIPALEKLLAAARTVFNLPPVAGMTGEGFLDDDVDAVLSSFWDFLEKKNPTPECSPMSPPAGLSSPSKTTTP